MAVLLVWPALPRWGSLVVPARRVDGSGGDRWSECVPEHAVPDGQPAVGPRPVLGQMQHRAALRACQSGGDVDDLTPKRGRATASWSVLRVPAARSRLWLIAAQIAQAELAANRAEGRWARGPSMRSANTVSMIAWRRWTRSACAVGSVLLVRNGWCRQTYPTTVATLVGVGPVGVGLGEADAVRLDQGVAGRGSAV
jgi:hypothetical protein